MRDRQNRKAAVGETRQRLISNHHKGPRGAEGSARSSDSTAIIAGRGRQCPRVVRQHDATLS